METSSNLCSALRLKSDFRQGRHEEKYTSQGDAVQTYEFCAEISKGKMVGGGHIT